MELESLSGLDRATANNVLAVMALSTSPNPGLSELEQNSEIRADADNALAEIRRRLSLREDDHSPRAQLAIDKLISQLIDKLVLPGTAAEEALRRAGRAGRLSPAAYKVVQPKTFRNNFYKLGVSKSGVDEAVHQPDDYQHLMTEDARENEEDLFSIFMKLSEGKRGLDENWLLIQSFRKGIEQIIQAAWRVYPQDVDLSKAKKPIDVLESFANSFGTNVVVGNKKAKFIESTSFTMSPQSADVSFAVHTELPLSGDYFTSWSNRPTKNPSIFSVGLAYSIDLKKYREALVRHGVSAK